MPKQYIIKAEQKFTGRWVLIILGSLAIVFACVLGFQKHKQVTPIVDGVYLTTVASKSGQKMYYKDSIVISGKNVTLDRVYFPDLG